MALDDNEPAKLTEEMRAEINPDSIDEMVEPMGIASQDIIQAEALEPEEPQYIETAKPKQVRKAKEVRSRSSKSESKSLSKLHGDLRKHTAARKKTDLAIKDIEKQLKALLLAHHSAIKDLKKQVTQLNAKVKAASKPKKIAGKKSRKSNKKSNKKR